jgi:TonB family protein
MRPPRHQNPEKAMNDIIDLEQKPSRRLWLLAAVGALALHLGGAALAVAHSRDVDDDSLGTPAIEIGLEQASTKSDPIDLPPGPNSDASVASAALAEQKAEVKETDLPKDTPIENAEADRVVTPGDVKKPVEDEAKVAKVETRASQESVAAEAAAAPSLDNAPMAQRSLAPAIGTGAAAHRVRATWQNELIAHLDRHKRYPSDRTTKEAEILVGFVLDRVGHVLSANIVKGSGDAAFDQAALSMLHRSDPVPAPPPLVANEGLNFTLPVVFKVKSKS